MTDTAPTSPPRAILKPLLFILAVMAVPAVIFVGARLVKPAYEKWACETNLKQIAAAVSQYSADHHGQYPDSFRTMLLHSSISASAFICPATNQSPANGEDADKRAADLTRDHISYTYLGGTYSGATVKPGSVLAYEPLSNHGDGLHVLYGDGHVAWIPAADADAFLQSVQPRRK
jgi:prepilin-type processing-associated H-X9-DG protein